MRLVNNISIIYVFIMLVLTGSKAIADDGVMFQLMPSQTGNLKKIQTKPANNDYKIYNQSYNSSANPDTSFVADALKNKASEIFEDKLKLKKPVVFGEKTPKILSDNDVELYKKIFKAQRDLKMSEVKSLAKQIQNKVLMGYLEAQWILNPKTKTTYKQLDDWLDVYNDHVIAKPIYKLAKSRAPKGKTPNKPAVDTPSIANYSNIDKKYSLFYNIDSKVQAILNKINKYNRKGDLSSVISLLSKPSVKKTLANNKNAADTLLAIALFEQGKLTEAKVLSEHVVENSDFILDANFTAGFANYKLGKYEQAASYFAEIVKNVESKSKYYSKAAFWAGRSYENAKKYDKAEALFAAGAIDFASFYGQVCIEKMNWNDRLSFQAPGISKEGLAVIKKSPVLNRVIALVQIGEIQLAQQEMKMAYVDIPKRKYDEDLLALSINLDLPSPSLTFAKNLNYDNKLYLIGLFPYSRTWQPYDGFVNLPLVQAIIKQESAFQPHLSSTAGASGLMQIMPDTAKYIRDVQNRTRLSNKDVLLPKYNISLGQKYIDMMLKKYDGNIIYALSAYNAGPGNLDKWIKTKIVDTSDPFLFIETIPFGETKDYVLKVVSNYWMYQHQFKQNSKSLKYLSLYQWPSSKALANNQLTTITDYR